MFVMNVIVIKLDRTVADVIVQPDNVNVVPVLLGVDVTVVHRPSQK